MIIKDTDSIDPKDYLKGGRFPDLFVSSQEKESKKYVRQSVDYFTHVAYRQCNQNKIEFMDNYDLLKGILRPKDFYMEQEGRGFLEVLKSQAELPAHIQHYSILNSPINTMIGELSKRPDGKRVKAFDDASKNEQLQYYTQITNQYIFENGKQKILSKLAAQGAIELPEGEELDAMTAEQVTEYMTNYTSLAERWANRMLDSLKMEFNTKELSEEAMRDLLICAREAYHVYEDNTKLGMGTEVVNPVELWKMTNKNKKYISDPSNRKSGAYAAGLLRAMEMSEILQRFNLDKEEIDFLRKQAEETSNGQPNVRRSNGINGVLGENSIKYDTYSPMELEERMLAEAELTMGRDPLQEMFGNPERITAYGNKFVVCEGYYESKIKIGRVTYLDENGDFQSKLVDEDYERIPNQIGEVEWTWDNQWYKFAKIGNHVYKHEPFELLTYCPIIGLTYEGKNTSQIRSFVDMLKPFQAIYNVCMNQLWELLEKEIGNVQVMSIRAVPRTKDADSQDDIDLWEEEARARGIVFVDDSIENMKAPSAFNQYKNIDLTRSNEIQSRYNLAVQMKLEAWELVGITRQRLGSTSGATESATATQSGLSQSYAQTEPIFASHEYLQTQWFQALLDAAQHVTVNNPESTLSFITTEGEQAFININSEDLRLRDLRIYVTSRAEDQQAFQELRMLSQAMLQNGASPYDIANLYATKSMRQMMDIFKSLKDKQESMMAEQQQMQQQDMAQRDEAVQAQIQADLIKHQSDQEFEAQQKQLDRLSKEKIAIISATGYGQVQNEDTDGDGIADALEISRLGMEQENARAQMSQQQQSLLAQNQAETNKLKIAMEKNRTDRANQANDLAIAKIQAKAKASQAAKKPAKKK